MMIGRMTVGLLCACAVSLVWARTGTVSVEKDGETFNVTFANHANETNGLWVVYGAADRGEGTNGWEHVEFLGTVTPATNDWQYAVPTGWGDTVKAIRFILSEVPYDVDYTIEYVAADQVKDSTNKAQGIPIKDFKLKGSDSVYVKFALNYISTKHNQTIFTTRNEAGTAPNIVLFWLSSKKFRYDYNASTASSTKLYEDASAVHEVVLDNSYMTIDGSEKVARPSTLFTGEATSDLMLLLGKPTSISNEGCGRIYALKVFDKDGALRLDLVPMVKGGKPGVYDRVNRNYYYSSAATENHLPVDAGPRVESENPFFASALCKAAVTGPEVFMPATYTEDPTSYTNAFGGILDGSSALKLTGMNDWGGQFTVSNGTLVADFGQGLGPNDNLLLVDGAYGGYDGLATNAVGNGAGEISVAASKYLTYGAVNGDLTVNIGGEGAPWVPTETDCRLKFAAPVGEGVVTFENPITLDPSVKQEPIIRNVTGKSVLAGNVTSPEGAKINLYGGDDFNSVGETVFAGSTNTFATFSQKSGGWTLGAGTTNIVNGNFNVEKGLFLATNAVIKMTGVLGYSSFMNVTGGKACICGGEALFGGITIGESASQSSKDYLRPQLTLAGKVTLDASLSPNAYGSMTICSSSASYALTLEDGADVRGANLNFYQRNVIHSGGNLVLVGSYGLNKMGEGTGTAGGTARYVLDGGRLEAAKASQSSVANAKAYFCFSGGTLANRVKTDSFFENFGPDSRVDVAGKFGGTFEVNYDTAITNDMMDSEFRSNTWNYQAEGYLTAPAFKKAGAKTLTLTGTCSYKCATDIAEGTLKLEGERAALPETGVVRVTGGTLDLGGKAQPLKALCGTAGEVKNGSVTVTEGIYPGGAGTIGSFSVGAALSGTLFVDVDATGAADSITTTTALDLSNIDLVITVPATAPEVPRRLKIVNGPHTGTFKSVSGLPAGWTLRYSDGRVSIGPDRGVVLFFR